MSLAELVFLGNYIASAGGSAGCRGAVGRAVAARRALARHAITSCVTSAIGVHACPTPQLGPRGVAPEGAAPRVSIETTLVVAVLPPPPLAVGVVVVAQ